MARAADGAASAVAAHVDLVTPNGSSGVVSASPCAQEMRGRIARAEQCNALVRARRGESAVLADLWYSMGHADPNCSEAAAPWLLRSTADSAALTFVLAGFCFLLGFASELLHALAHRRRAEASCIRAAAAPLAQLPVAPLAQLPAPPPPPLRPCAATERSAATKPAAGTAAVKALRAAGEAAWGGRLPVALDDDVYLAALVAKQARDHAADEGYARRKLTAAVRWRMEMAYVAGGEAGAGEAAAASRGGEEFAAAPIATHALVCGVPRVAALLRGDRPEPCAAPNQ